MVLRPVSVPLSGNPGSFGTRLQRPAELAAELFHRGIAPVIVVTGGPSRHDGRVEARLHESILLRSGVPSDAILVEDRSSHTGENVDFALALLDKHGVIPRTVAAVAKIYHRRALLALADRSPKTDVIFTATYDVPLTDQRRSKELRYYSDFVRRGVDPSYLHAQVGGELPPVRPCRAVAQNQIATNVAPSSGSIVTTAADTPAPMDTKEPATPAKADHPRSRTARARDPTLGGCAFRPAGDSRAGAPADQRDQRERSGGGDRKP